MNKLEHVRYTDHPAPSVSLIILQIGAIGVMSAAVPEALKSLSGSPSSFLPIVIVGLILAVLMFYCWPFYSTYYGVTSTGLTVQYGPWRMKYTWADFSSAYRQTGLFSTRIGWPTITPCVRLTNAVVLERTKRRYALFLTPNNPQMFLSKIAEFAPDLTRGTIA